MYKLENSASPHIRRGILCEQRVIQYCLDKGWSLIRQRYKILHVEVDLVFHNPIWGYMLVEVKSLHQNEFKSFRLSSIQKKRLYRVYHYVLQKTPKACFKVVFVHRDDRIEWFDLI